MKSTLLRISLFAVSALSFGLTATAQSQNVPIEYLRPMKNSFSIGVRSFGGAKVTFGGSIGAIANFDIRDESLREDMKGAYGYIIYDNGQVSPDTADDTANGKRSTPGPREDDGRWYYTTTYTSTTSGLTQDYTTSYLAYDPSATWTRNWTAKSQDQVKDGTAENNNAGTHEVWMSTYSSSGIAPGQTVQAEDGANPGIEMQMGRVMQRFKRFEWGINFTIGISEFNAKTRQTVRATAKRLTDVYQVYSSTPGSPVAPGKLTPTDAGGYELGGPTFDPNAVEFTDPDNPSGDKITDPSESAYKYNETTAALSLNRIRTADETDFNGALVNGYWQVKGVYYLMRIGPMARIPVGRHFSVSFGAGYMGAWIGSKFRFEETLLVNGSAIRTNSSTEKYSQQYLSGFYADANIEWWVSTKTGFFGGLGYEKLGNYTQKAYDRTATVKMDNGLGFRFGLITRF